VAVIETMTFRLRPGVDEAEFLGVDKRLQSEFAYQQPGLVRRTTGHADAMSARWDEHPLVAEFMAHVDAGTVEVRRYTTLD
jgi:hypothetical protein